MAVTVGPIGSAPAPGSTPIGDRRVDLTTGTIWRNDGTTWNADERIRDDVLAAVLAEPTSLTHAAAGSAVPAATETAPGKVELATAAETATGTDTTRAVHPAGLKPLLDAKAGVVADSGWISVTFQNGWADFGPGYSTGQYRKIGNRVSLKGMVKNGTMGSPIFTLPSAYRPANSELVQFPVASNDAFGIVYINGSGGVISNVGSNVWVALTGITFLVD